MQHSPLKPLVAVSVAVAVLALALVHASPGAAQTAPTSSRIRLGHFSPDTPEMDVYVVGFDGSETRVLEGLGYGEVSDYAPLEPGSYTFLLRPAGSPADTDPAVTASADLAAESAYTFAALGPQANLQQALVTDDLGPPPPGQAKVRLIQASSSAAEVDITAADGPVLADGVPFATTTDYAAVAAGPWTVQVTSSSGSTELVRQLALDPGTVSSLVVLEGTNGAPFELTRVVDATGVDASADAPLGINQAMPLGGVATGAGGTASADAPDGRSTSAAGYVVPTGLALALALAVAFALGGWRRLRHRPT